MSPPIGDPYNYADHRCLETSCGLLLTPPPGQAGHSCWKVLTRCPAGGLHKTPNGIIHLGSGASWLVRGAEFSWLHGKKWNATDGWRDGEIRERPFKGACA